MQKSEKIKYEIDPSGRLSFLRTVLDGEFSIDKDNILTYRAKKMPASSIPQQLKIFGNWSLDNRHNLMLTLDKENNQWAGDKLTLKGQIIDAKADELVFGVSIKDSDGKAHFYTLKLGGKWQIDKYNRFIFLVTKEHDKFDTLTFSGSWKVNKQNQIIYTYTKAGLKRREKLARSIAFKGYWDINTKNRISYILDKDMGSGFDFKVSLGKPAPRGLQYEIGVGATGKKKKFLLFGSWKVSEKLGFSFEMPYEEGKMRCVVFGATCKIAKGTNIEFRLRNNLRKDLGINLRLSKKILGESGDIFIEALKERKEASIFAGIGFRW